MGNHEDNKIEIMCPEHFGEITAKAAELNKIKDINNFLNKVCRWLSSGQDDRPQRVRLFKEFYMPHSLYFEWQVEEVPGKWGLKMNGGFIFHESSQSWSTHT
jgi:hypothetical protein